MKIFAHQIQIDADVTVENVRLIISSNVITFELDGVAYKMHVDNKSGRPKPSNVTFAFPSGKDTERYQRNLRGVNVFAQSIYDAIENYNPIVVLTAFTE
ncbi:hypothetical protein YDYSY3_29230 [Paenibacillus chitinolyticus]|nr:hypothetical protein YDYSY3_29230 [Paenibacillus chitinolyticus]